MRFYVNLFPGQSPPGVTPPASGITHSPASPTKLANAAINTVIANFTLINGTGRGNWNAVTVQPLFILTPNLRTAEVKLSRNLTAADINSFPYQVQYSGEDGMVGSVTDSFTLVVSAVPVAPPTGFTIDDATPEVTIEANANDVVTGLDLTLGAATGTWALSGTNVAADFKLSSNTGRSPNILLNRDMVAADLSKTWLVNVTYSGEGLATPLSMNLTPTCVAVPIGAPTNLTHTTGVNLVVGNVGPKAISTLTVVDGAGNGAWSIDSTTFSKVEMSAATGRNSNLRLTTGQTVVAADVGTGKTTTVKYVEGVTTLTEALGYDVVNPAPTGVTVGTINNLTVGDAANTVITTLTLVGGTAAGTWSKTSGWAKVELSSLGPNVRSPNVRVNAAVVAADVNVAGRQGVFRYTGEGVTFDATVNFLVEAAVVAPTMDLADKAIVANRAADGTDIATATVSGGAGTGLWTMSTVPDTAPLELFGTNARSRTVQLSRALLAADDADTWTITVKYDEAGYSTAQQAMAVTASARQQITWKTGISGGEESDADMTGGGILNLNKHDAWLGRTTAAKKSKWYCQFLGAGGNGWNNIYPDNEGHIWLLEGMIRKGVTVSMSMPVCTNAEQQNATGDVLKTKFDPLINGNNDTVIQNMAKRIKAAYHRGLGGNAPADGKYPLLCYRFGWEMTNEGFPWWVGSKSTTGPVGFKNGFNKVSSLVKEITPGCKIEWCLQKGYKENHKILHHDSDDPADWTCDIYPGNTHVTHITIDWYDAYPYGTDTNWNTASGMNWQNREVFNFARGNNKKFGITEWGLRNKFRWTGPGETKWREMAGGADNEYFMSGMWKFFQECETNHPGVLDFECYYQPHEHVWVDPDGKPADKSYLSQVALQHYDGCHSFYWDDGGTIRVNGPWNGRTDGNNNCTNPATCKGVLVGQQNYNLADGNNQKATGRAGAEYKRLFGEP